MKVICAVHFKIHPEMLKTKVAHIGNKIHREYQCPKCFNRVKTIE